MRRISLALICAACAVPAAEKKPITLEVLASHGRPPSLVSPVWAPDGKRFVVVESRKLWLYDVPKREKKELVSLAALEAAAVKGPAPGAYAFENRNVREDVV